MRLKREKNVKMEERKKKRKEPSRGGSEIHGNQRKQRWMNTTLNITRSESGADTAWMAKDKTAITEETRKRRMRSWMGCQ